MKLKQIKSNFHCLEINGKVIYFSYETPIGFDRSTAKESHFAVSDKFFSVTTSKHQNLIDIDKRFRIPHDELINLIERNF